MNTLETMMARRRVHAHQQQLQAAVRKIEALGERPPKGCRRQFTDEEIAFATDPGRTMREVAAALGVGHYTVTRLRREHRQ